MHVRLAIAPAGGRKSLDPRGAGAIADRPDTPGKPVFLICRESALVRKSCWELDCNSEPAWPEAGGGVVFPPVGQQKAGESARRRELHRARRESRMRVVIPAMLPGHRVAAEFGDNTWDVRHVRACFRYVRRMFRRHIGGPPDFSGPLGSTRPEVPSYPFRRLSPDFWRLVAGFFPSLVDFVIFKGPPGR